MTFGTSSHGVGLTPALMEPEIKKHRSGVTPAVLHPSSTFNCDEMIHSCVPLGLTSTALCYSRIMINKEYTHLGQKRNPYEESKFPF
jgi:hypothetical protein